MAAAASASAATTNKQAYPWLPLKVVAKNPIPRSQMRAMPSARPSAEDHALRLKMAIPLIRSTNAAVPRIPTSTRNDR